MKQGILGASKNNILFTVQDNPENNHKDVYFGFEKILSVPNNKKSANFQYAMVFLYQNGVAPKHIEDNFAISFKTIKKWDAIATNCKTLQELAASIKHAGRTEYKLNDKIRKYIIEQVEFYKKTNVHGFNIKTVEDVAKKYKITISVETVRREYANRINSVVSKTTITEADMTEKVEAENCSISENRNSAPSVEEKKIFQNMYAGVLLLSAGIKHIAAELTAFSKDIQKNVTVWLFGILLGFKNLENYRYTHHNDFQFICQYHDVRSVETMRQELKQLSIKEEIGLSSLFLQNVVKNYRKTDNHDYYVDGHEIEYTGDEKILQGWNTKKNRVAKGYTSYFVHDSNGTPLFCNTLDHFYDFREVIRMILPKIKRTSHNKRFVLIYDRGGFSIDLMKEIEEANGAFISWEKGFDKNSIDSSTVFDKEVIIEFPYNDLGNFRSYKVRYAVQSYTRKDFRCKRIIILREGENKEKMLQSIVASDSLSDCDEIIRKLLKRFVQENDFKKQKGHFGIDEITSYDKLAYNALGDKTDKAAYNKKYRDKLDAIAVLKTERAGIFKMLGIKYYSSLKKKLKDNADASEIINRINELNKLIKQNKAELKSIQKTISKIKKNEEEGIKEIDLRPKRIMDMIKITARNIFQNGSIDFLNVYKNLRDYQKVFRLLTRDSGTIEIESGIMNVRLNRIGRKKFQDKCEKYFEILNEQKHTTYNGKYVLCFGWWN